MNYSTLMNYKNFIYLKALYEQEALTILVDRGKAIADTVPAITEGEVVIEANPIVRDEALPVLQLQFPSYVAYSVRNEAYFPMDAYENSRVRPSEFTLNLDT